MFASGWVWALGLIVLFVAFPGPFVLVLLVAGVVGVALASAMPEHRRTVTLDPDDIDEVSLAELNHRVALRRLRERRERLAPRG